MFNIVFDNFDFAHKLDGQTLPSDDFTKHMHSFCEVLFFIRGDIVYTLDSESRKLVMGDMLIIPPGLLHFGTVNLRKPYERYVLKFPLNFLPPFLAEKINGHPPYYSKCSYLLPFFEELDEICDNYDDNGKSVLLPMQLLKILINLDVDNQAKQKTEVTTNPLIDAIISYVNDHIYEPITLDDISRDLHYSKSYVCSEFSKELKIPLMTFIKNKKIISAYKDLCRGEVKLSVLAKKYGFTDYSTFYRNYMRIIGSAPKSTT